MNECVLTLIATPEFEERLTDWLLESGHLGFTSAACSGHGMGLDALSVAEQVVGRQRQVVFWIQVPEQDARSIVSRLRADFSGAGLHYWMTPVLSSGPIMETSAF